MKLYLKELKNYRKGLFFWSLGILVFIGASMAKYQTLQATGQSANELVAQFPQAIRTIFGIEGFDLMTASGYYAVLYMYAALMLSVHAILVSTDIISKEERDKTSEFLFTKPITRTAVITQKLLAGLTHVVLLNLITGVLAVVFVGAYNKGPSVSDEIILLNVGLLMLQLLFFAIGAAIASWTSHPKRAGSLASAILLGTFIISFLININQSLDPLKYLTPFKYFDAKQLLEQHGVEVGYMILSAGIIVVATWLTYRFYRRRDLTV